MVDLVSLSLLVNFIFGVDLGIKVSNFLKSKNASFILTMIIFLVDQTERSNSTAQFSFLVSDMNTRYEIAYGRNYDKLPRVL